MIRIALVYGYRVSLHILAVNRKRGNLVIILNLLYLLRRLHNDIFKIHFVILYSDYILKEFIYSFNKRFIRPAVNYNFGINYFYNVAIHTVIVAVGYILIAPLRNVSDKYLALYLIVVFISNPFNRQSDVRKLFPHLIDLAHKQRRKSVSVNYLKINLAPVNKNDVTGRTAIINRLSALITLAVPVLISMSLARVVPSAAGEK